ncbi:MAG: TetR/AcrR family transcriptional regulator [Lachnospiraceae bacterium]|nr:TetR/AcrR family transcriptional regulator [Lachnospiraceae bacterium]
MEEVGGAKGMFYRFFQSKEEVMQALGDRMFFRNNRRCSMVFCSTGSMMRSIWC